MKADLPPHPMAGPHLLTNLGQMVLEALLPVSVFLFLRHKQVSEFHSIVAASCVPVLSGLWSLRRGASLNPTTVVMLAALLVTFTASLLGGSTRILLLRESLVTAALGLACLLSLPTRRPLMFFFSRYLIAGRDRAAAATFTERLKAKDFLQAFRIITFTWSATLLSEFGARCWLVYHAKPATVLAVSPVLNSLVIFGTLSWAFWFGKRRHLI